MTIKQQGGIFGRNPTFNELNTDGDVSVGGDLSVATDVTISNGNLSIAQSTPTIDLIDLQDVNDVAQIFSSAGSLDLKADINNDKGSSRIMFEIDGSEVGRWLAGGGLCFNGDTAAANALDDYEEGTFTVAATRVTDLTTNVARYTKIGNLVTCEINISWTSTDGTGNVVLFTGLPFTSASGSETPVGAVLAYGTDIETDIGEAIVLRVDDDETRFILSPAIGSSLTNVNSSNMNSSTTIRSTFTYRAA